MLFKVEGRQTSSHDDNTRLMAIFQNNIIYDEAMITEATDNMETGISVVGRIFNTIRYTDDKAVVANSQKGLQQLMDNLKINAKKTKVMRISRNENNKLKIHVGGQQVEQVSQFRFLGR